MKLTHNKIKCMREEGKSYQAIASFLGISKSTVQSYCRRNKIKVKNHLNGSQESMYVNCLNCGKELKQISKQKPKKFCSDQCRYKWWSLKNSEKKICDYCKKPFMSSTKNRKYCSHECYINNRFKVGEKRDKRAV